MTSPALPLCYTCKHLKDVEKFVCTAFPKGIPNPIAYGEVQHDTPYPGDHGIQFELDPTAEAKYRKAAGVD